MPTTHQRVTRNRIIGAAALVVLVVAMILSTKFLTPEELAASRPKEFNPTEEATALFQQAQQELPGSASELADVVPAIQSDIQGAAEQYNAVSPTENSYVFPVTATATVTEASGSSLRLQVEGVPQQTSILVPIATAVNGTVIRDAMGFKFADAPGQTEYQYVGDEIKKLILSDVVDPLGEPADLEGKEITVVGAVNVQDTGSPVAKAKPINIQPVTIEAGS